MKASCYPLYSEINLLMVITEIQTGPGAAFSRTSVYLKTAPGMLRHRKKNLLFPSCLLPPVPMPTMCPHSHKKEFSGAKGDT